MEWSVPTYSYRCKACGDSFDIQQSFTDDALTVCEACGGELRKLFNSVGVVFKGSGFYRNDSRSKPSEITAKDSTSSKSDASSGSSDKAPATPSEKSSSSTSAPAAPAASS